VTLQENFVAVRVRWVFGDDGDGLRCSSSSFSVVFGGYVQGREKLSHVPSDEVLHD
jgi:hypothetical protein